MIDSFDYSYCTLLYPFGFWPSQKHNVIDPISSELWFTFLTLCKLITVCIPITDANKMKISVIGFILLSCTRDNLDADALSAGKATTRRTWFEKQAVMAASVVAGTSVVGYPSAANAASIPTPAELEKLRKGHARIQYLLENWDKETQVCGKMVMSDSERKQVIRTEGRPMLM
jgi:hypothetical protein